MNGYSIGVSFFDGLDGSLISDADYIELKKITPAEARRIRSMTDKPIYFHLQYDADGRFIKPSSRDFVRNLGDFTGAYEIAGPDHISFHFGPAAEDCRADMENCTAVATGPLLDPPTLVGYTERNLELLKNEFPNALILLENLEFIPEFLSRGAYRYIQEHDFFTEQVTRFRELGLLDGIVFDVAHGLITSGNHPRYSGVDEKGSEDADFNAEEARRKNPRAILKSFELYAGLMPLEQVREIHISGIGKRPDGVYIDKHGEIGDTELAALGILLDKSNSPGHIPITIEYARNPGRIPVLIDRLRGYLDGIFKKQP